MPPARHRSTRRRAPDGVVHEMADLGVGTLCGLRLPEPWTWVDGPSTCPDCLRLEAQARAQEALDDAR